MKILEIGLPPLLVQLFMLALTAVIATGTVVTALSVEESRRYQQCVAQAQVSYAANYETANSTAYTLAVDRCAR